MPPDLPTAVWRCETWITRTRAPALPPNLHLIGWESGQITVAGDRRAVEEWADDALYLPPERVCPPPANHAVFSPRCPHDH